MNSYRATNPGEQALIENIRKAIRKLSWRDFLEHWFVFLFLASLVLAFLFLDPLSDFYFKHEISKGIYIGLVAIGFGLVGLIVTILFVVYVEGTEPLVYKIPKKRDISERKNGPIKSPSTTSEVKLPQIIALFFISSIIFWGLFYYEVMDEADTLGEVVSLVIEDLIHYNRFESTVFNLFVMVIVSTVLFIWLTSTHIKGKSRNP